MTFRTNFCLLATATIFSLTIAQTQAATTGLWLFDSMTTTEGGDQFADSSGNDLHFTKGSATGTAILSNDVPPVAPAGSSSLAYTFGNSVDTPSTDLLSIGKTGQLTIEFWYKPLLVDSTRRILAQENHYPNAPWNWWALAQMYRAGPGSPIDLYTTIDPSGGAVIDDRRHKSEDAFLDADNPEWLHFAVTVDGSSGAMRMYRDGVLEDEGGEHFGPYANMTSTLRLGSNNPNNGKKGMFLMDELRISNVVLLPGDGTGNGELAWNASLVPEPASLVMLGLGSLACFYRRPR